MARELFGTDGIRGTANQPPMTAEIALRLGMAAGGYFTRGDHRHRVVIGKDTRLSGYMLEPALTAGFIAMGMDVTLLSPLPTPGVAMLTRSLRADLGVMISASHNPYQDNGIKLFGPDGYKLSDDIELAIEERMRGACDSGLAAPNLLGRAVRLEGARGRYIEALKASLPRGMTLNGLKIVIDCANGAAYGVAPKVLWELGAEVIEVGTSPNGFNINARCGSTHPQAMCAAVREHGADVGIALDGDADRVVLADERGELIDGDQILALLANSWQAEATLRGDGVVATTMSNLGLERYLQGRGLKLHRTQVGDRYVVEHMRELGAQSRWRAVRPRHHDRLRDHRGRAARRAADPRRDAPPGAPDERLRARLRALAAAAAQLPPERRPAARPGRGPPLHRARRGASRRTGPHDRAALRYRAADPRHGRGRRRDAARRGARRCRRHDRTLRLSDFARASIRGALGTR